MPRLCAHGMRAAQLSPKPCCASMSPIDKRYPRALVRRLSARAVDPGDAQPLRPCRASTTTVGFIAALSGLKPSSVVPLAPAASASAAPLRVFGDNGKRWRGSLSPTSPSPVSRRSALTGPSSVPHGPGAAIGPHAIHRRCTSDGSRCLFFTRFQVSDKITGPTATVMGVRATRLAVAVA